MKVFSTPYFTIEAITSPCDREPYYKIVQRDSVLALVLGKEQEIILVRQYRPIVQEYTLEFPAGSVEENESPLEAVEREVGEELGLVCDFTYLGPAKLQVNRSSSFEHIFFGRELCILDVNLHQTERVRISIDNFRSMVRQGKFQQIAALGILPLLEIKTGLRII